MPRHHQREHGKFGCQTRGWHPADFTRQIKDRVVGEHDSCKKVLVYGLNIKHTFRGNSDVTGDTSLKIWYCS